MGAQAVRLSNVDINNALKNKDFEVLFQPIFDLSNGALARMETFVRWRHRTLGALPPGAFISFFESQGRMGELTRYVLDQALTHYNEWRGPYAPGFSINLSIADLSDDAFTSHLTAALQASDFPADLITLECPMPAVDSDLEGMLTRFSALRETGVRLAIEVRGRADDFLRTVDPFPFDEIKTGGSSILRFARTVRGPGLSAISDLLDIARKANAVTTAVGVEDQASLSALRGLGFAAAQGNHLARVGELSDFRQSQVNRVRELLELNPLNGEELSALFRTSPPTPQSAPMDMLQQTPEAAPEDPVEAKAAAAAEEIEAKDARAEEQSPVDALSADADALAEDAVETPDTDEETQDPAAATPSQKADEPAKAPAPDDEAALKKRQALVASARKKAKAIAMAKRAKARDARKAAAIQQAKDKVAKARENVADLASDLWGDQDLAERQQANAEAATESPQVLQDRLAREFVEPAPEPEIAFEGETPIIEPDAAAIAAHEKASPDNDKAQFNMPIGPAGAHFRPGIHVSGAPETIGVEEPGEQWNSGPYDSPSMVDVAFEEDEDEAVATADEDFIDDSVDVEDDGSAADTFGSLLGDAPTVSTDPGNDHAPVDKIETPSLDKPAIDPKLPLAAPEDDQAEDEILTAPHKSGVNGSDRKAPPRNLLTRRYKIVGKHFWPKSWKRAYQRQFGNADPEN